MTMHVFKVEPVRHIHMQLLYILL